MEILIKSKILTLRKSRKSDLLYIKETESAKENKPYIFQWSKGKHFLAMSNPDIMHIIIEENSTAKAVGYIIIAGVLNDFNNMEFMRFAISKKGLGYGKEALSLAKKMAFEKFNVHRLWLDVKEHNKIARNLYVKEKFTQEGIFRDYVIYEGKYENVVIMSILADEYFDK